ncbi:MAG: hypothetical protein LBN98_01320 [Prevotellaceae bacterium]|nr:hypothetical protein [Prevotellaceae bacterium]
MAKRERAGSGSGRQQPAAGSRLPAAAVNNAQPAVHSTVSRTATAGCDCLLPAAAARCLLLPAPGCHFVAKSEDFLAPRQDFLAPSQEF